MPDDKTRDDFTELLTRLMRVSKKEIDKREQAYRANRKTTAPAPPRNIAPVKKSHS